MTTTRPQHAAPTDWPAQRAEGFPAARSLGTVILAFLGMVAAVVLVVLLVLAWVAPPAAATVRPPLTGGRDDHGAWIVGGVLILLVAAIAAARWAVWVYRRRVPVLADVKRPAASPAAGRHAAAARLAFGPKRSPRAPSHRKDRR